ncbi:MAG: WG repeat-containing protein [Clostridia bacterium]|nr:WG repeat-containing protein [Clostridia bacterium]
MKKISAMSILLLTLLFILPSCTPVKQPDSSATETTEEKNAPSVNIYIDTLSDAGFGYKYCYTSESMSGNVGIADKNGSILLNPAYVSVQALSKDRFIARKFIEQSPHSALVNENGKEIIAFFRGEIRRINNVSGDAEPILSVEPFGKKAYFANLNGQRISDYDFNGTGFTESGLIYGYTDNEYYIFNGIGKLLCSVEKGKTTELYPINDDYTMLVKHCGNGLKYGVKDSQEKEIIPCEYDEIQLISYKRLVARIGQAQSIEPDDIVRFFDEKGTQLSKDGEFNSVSFNESKYGIACKLEMGVVEPELKYCLVNKNGKKISDEYDSIHINENNEYIGKINSSEMKIDIPALEKSDLT